jgi:hypothetical protein
MVRTAMTEVRQRVGLVILACLVAGCGALFERGEEGELFPETRAGVRVVNNNFYDVTVYLDRSGHRERLGRVTGNRTEVFHFDAHVGIYAAFAISVQAGRTFTTQRITINPGDEIEVVVPPDLDRR